MTIPWLPSLNYMRWIKEIDWHRQKRALSKIELIVLDVDGVLTDGGLWFDDNGGIQKRFNVRDGLGIRLLKEEGLLLALISGGRGTATEIRASQLGIDHCLVGVKNKPAALLSLQRNLGLTPEHTAFLGDDLNDLPVRDQVSLLLATADACAPLKAKANAILQNRGGHGAVRELAERVLKSRGCWSKYSRYGWIDIND